MTESEPNTSGIVPVSKRHSLLESPDIGERWPERFDAITIEQLVTRPFKAKEARRQLDYFFEIPLKRDQTFLHGVIWHFPNNENQSVVMFDTNTSYMRVNFLTSTILGNSIYGYAPTEPINVLCGDKNFEIGATDYLTYFKTPRDFEPVQGEVLGMMIGAARDQVLSFVD